MWQVPPLEQGKLTQALMGISQFWPWRRGQSKIVNNWTLDIFLLEIISLFKQRQIQCSGANQLHANGGKQTVGCLSGAGIKGHPGTSLTTEYSWQCFLGWEAVKGSCLCHNNKKPPAGWLWVDLEERGSGSCESHSALLYVLKLKGKAGKKRLLLLNHIQIYS